jgi:hypothetical protein
MSDELPAASMPTPEERERVTAELCDHFAAGHIELDVLEQRLAEVDTAESQGQLVKLVGDLPALAVGPVVPVGAAVQVAEPAARRGWALALLGGNSRKGVWSPPRKLNAVAVMGGVELDFRDARLPPGETHVVAVAVMGGVEIIVPPGLAVTVRGLGILGGVDQEEHAPGEIGPNTAHLKVTALACMGGIGIKVRVSQRAERIASKPTR